MAAQKESYACVIVGCAPEDEASLVVPLRRQYASLETAILRREAMPTPPRWVHHERAMFLSMERKDVTRCVTAVRNLYTLGTTTHIEETWRHVLLHAVLYTPCVLFGKVWSELTMLHTVGHKTPHEGQTALVAAALMLLHGADRPADMSEVVLHCAEDVHDHALTWGDIHQAATPPVARGMPPPPVSFCAASPASVLPDEEFFPSNTIRRGLMRYVKTVPGQYYVTHGGDCMVRKFTHKCVDPVYVDPIAHEVHGNPVYVNPMAHADPMAREAVRSRLFKPYPESSNPETIRALATSLMPTIGLTHRTHGHEESSQAVLERLAPYGNGAGRWADMVVQLCQMVRITLRYPTQSYTARKRTALRLVGVLASEDVWPAITTEMQDIAFSTTTPAYIRSLLLSNIHQVGYLSVPLLLALRSTAINVAQDEESPIVHRLDVLVMGYLRGVSTGLIQCTGPYQTHIPVLQRLLLNMCGLFASAAGRDALTDEEQSLVHGDIRRSKVFLEASRKMYEDHTTPSTASFTPSFTPSGNVSSGKEAEEAPSGNDALLVPESWTGHDTMLEKQVDGALQMSMWTWARTDDKALRTWESARFQQVDSMHRDLCAHDRSTPCDVARGIAPNLLWCVAYSALFRRGVAPLLVQYTPPRSLSLPRSLLPVPVPDQGDPDTNVSPLHTVSQTVPVVYYDAGDITALFCGGYGGHYTLENEVVPRGAPGTASHLIPEPPAPCTVSGPCCADGFVHPEKQVLTGVPLVCHVPDPYILHPLPA